MDYFEEFIMKHKKNLMEQKVRLNFAKAKRSDSLNHEEPVVQNNSKVTETFDSQNDKEKTSLESSSNQTKSFLQDFAVRNHPIQPDDLNMFAKHKIDFSQLSSGDFNQSDPNNSCKNTDNHSDNSNSHENENKTSYTFSSRTQNAADVDDGMSKTKEFQAENNENNHMDNYYTLENFKPNNWTRRNRKDEMEQWISDTFYSYFPSLNSEQTKRENNIRARQLDYQNYLKKTSNVGQNEGDVKTKNINNDNNHAAVHRNDKSDMEIIVTTNPNYESSLKNREKYNNVQARPSSTRDKLLQDLKHTEISNLIYGDAGQLRQQAEVERDTEKKKEYQKDLMRQIEEKRREIELLKEKERIDEENLTRKLEQQLRTVQLQEQLEKEKIITERTRFEVERNKIIREQLISKLEKDQMLVKSPVSSVRETKSENDKDSLTESITNNEKTKSYVYRLFKNSARENQQSFPAHAITDDFEQFGIKSNENLFSCEQPSSKSYEGRKRSPYTSTDCLHLNQKNCPFCETKLKHYESNCPYCEQQILDDGAENRVMLCENCENQYLICSSCDKQKIICEFCNRKRNICPSCTRLFCIQCGNSICKKKHSKKSSTNNPSRPKRSTGSSEHSFQILELPNFETSDTPLTTNRNSNFSIGSEKSKNYSVNYSKNSIFNPEHKYSSPFFEFGMKNGEVVINNRIYKSTNELHSDRSTMNHSKNYVDNMSTNTMPLLSKMPKKSNLKSKKSSRTRSILKDSSKTDDSSMEDLFSKWEDPSIEKRTDFINSPIVLTQVGAVRRKLQLDRMQSEM